MHLSVSYWRDKYFKGRCYDCVFHLQVDHACGGGDDEETFLMTEIARQSLAAHLQLPSMFIIEFVVLNGSMESRP